MGIEEIYGGGWESHMPNMQETCFWPPAKPIRLPHDRIHWLSGGICVTVLIGYLCLVYYLALT